MAQDASKKARADGYFTVAPKDPAPHGSLIAALAAGTTWGHPPRACEKPFGVFPRPDGQAGGGRAQPQGRGRRPGLVPVNSEPKIKQQDIQVVPRARGVTPGRTSTQTYPGAPSRSTAQPKNAEANTDAALRQRCAQLPGMIGHAFKRARRSLGHGLEQREATALGLD